MKNTVRLSTPINKPLLHSRTKPSHSIVEQTKCSIDICVVHSNTSDQWHLALCPMAERWPSEGWAPLGGGGQKDSPCLYPSPHIQTKACNLLSPITSRQGAAMARRRLASGHVSTAGWSSCLNRHDWHGVTIFIQLTHRHTYHHYYYHHYGHEEKGNETSRLLIRMAK